MSIKRIPLPRGFYGFVGNDTVVSASGLVKLYIATAEDTRLIRPRDLWEEQSNQVRDELGQIFADFHFDPNEERAKVFLGHLDALERSREAFSVDRVPVSNPYMVLRQQVSVLLHAVMGYFEGERCLQLNVYEPGEQSSSFSYQTMRSRIATIADSDMVSTLDKLKARKIRKALKEITSHGDERMKELLRIMSEFDVAGLIAHYVHLQPRPKTGKERGYR